VIASGEPVEEQLQPAYAAQAHYRDDLSWENDDG